MAAGIAVAMDSQIYFLKTNKQTMVLMLDSFILKWCSTTAADLTL